MKSFLSIPFVLLSATLVHADPSGCVSWKGKDVPTIEDTSLTFFGEAAVDGSGNLVITANPDLLKTVSPVVHEYWYNYECVRFAFSAESIEDYEADCFTVRYLRDTETLKTEDDLEDLIAEFQNMSESLWPVHRPQDFRLDNMRVCFST